MKIILASKSPRRKQLMEMARIDYEIIVSNSEEKVDKSLSLEEQSVDLAYQKAKIVFDHTQGDRCVIGADTLVIVDGKPLGKPKTRKESKEMLKMIQGRKHEVFTAYSILIEKGGKVTEIKDLDIAEIYLSPISEMEIENYIEKEQPFDYAGSYAIQSSFCVYVDKIDGNYNTIMGLPINKIYAELKDNEIIC